MFFFFFQAEDGIRDTSVTGVQTCALPISNWGVRIATVAIRTPQFASASPAAPDISAISKPSVSKIGRASCRERVEIAEVDASSKKKRENKERARGKRGSSKAEWKSA